MKKLLILSACIICSFVASSGDKAPVDYSIVFGGCFEKDIVTLSINKKKVLSNYKLENQNEIKKGHLSLTQTGNKIYIFYNRNQKSVAKIPIDFILDIQIIINNQTQNLKIDLRKGKVIVLDFCNAEAGRKLSCEQVQEPVVLF